MLDEADRDGDGMLNFDEFYRIIWSVNYKLSIISLSKKKIKIHYIEIN